MKLKPNFPVFRNKFNQEFLNNKAKKIIDEGIFSFIDSFNKHQSLFYSLFLKKTIRRPHKGKIKKIRENSSELIKEIGEKNNLLTLINLRKYLVEYWKVSSNNLDEKIHSYIKKNFLNVTIAIFLNKLDDVLCNNGKNYTKLWKIIKQTNSIKNSFIFRERLLARYEVCSKLFQEDAEIDLSQEAHSKNLEKSSLELKIRLQSDDIRLKDIKITKWLMNSVLEECTFIHQEIERKKFNLNLFLIIAQKDLNKLLDEAISQYQRAIDLVLVSKTFITKDNSDRLIFNFNSGTEQSEKNLPSDIAWKLVNYCDTNIFYLNKLNNIKHR